MRSLLYSPFIPNFLRVPPQFSGEVMFNTQRQQYKFVNCPGAEVDVSLVIYHENHNKCYYFIDTSKLRSATLATFPFGTKFVLYKDRHLHVLHSRLHNVDLDSAQVSDVSPNKRHTLPSGNPGPDLLL